LEEALARHENAAQETIRLHGAIKPREKSLKNRGNQVKPIQCP
jgi:hypothetical protein